MADFNWLEMNFHVDPEFKNYKPEGSTWVKKCLTITTRIWFPPGMACIDINNGTESYNYHSEKNRIDYDNVFGHYGTQECTSSEFLHHFLRTLK